VLDEQAMKRLAQSVELKGTLYLEEERLVVVMGVREI